MRFFFSVFCFCVYHFACSQNALSLTSVDGKAFKVLVKNTVYNATPQAHVTLENILTDTLRIEIELENKKKFPLTIYLLEKGEPVKQKEFSYHFSTDNNNIRLQYSGSYAVVKLPNPLVPDKPSVDTSSKYKNGSWAHFCEFKEGKVSYFNNLVKDKPCVSAMSAEYLNYLHLLMSRASVQEEKQRIAEHVLRNNCISTLQVKQILKYVDYEVEKLKLVKIAYFNLVDPENQKDLESNFTFEASVNELNTFLKNSESYRIKTAEACQFASPASEMDVYISKLAALPDDSQKLDLLKNSYTNLCYSTAQVSRILQKFVHDRERLHAAKLLYFKCAQKDKFADVSDTFSYNQSVSELKEFIDKQQN